MADEKRDETNGSNPVPDDAGSPDRDGITAPADDAVRAQESAEALTEPVDETDDEPSGVEPTDAELAADERSDEELSDDDGSGDDRELVGVGAPSKRRTSSAGGSEGAEVVAKGRTKKDKATPKQHQVAERPKRTTPAQFVREAVGELRKVVYPTGSQLGNYFVVVLVFVLFIIGVVSLLDLGFGWVIFRIFA